MEQARRRKEIALADLREMEARKRRGELIEVESARKQWAEGLAMIRDRILGLPDRLGARLAQRDEMSVRTILRDELETTLRAIHDGAPGTA